MIDRTLFRTIVLSLIAVSACLRGVWAEDVARSGSVDARTSEVPKPSANFSVNEDETGWWLVSPEGERFFSLGVCMFNQGSEKAEFDHVKPSYAALRHYDAPVEWADASLRRLKSWGFSTVGGWSDYETLAESNEHDLCVTPVLHLGSTSGAPWFDMWDPKVLRRIEEVAVEEIVPLRDDPRVIGYFSDNELGWWNAIMWKMTLEQPATSGQRQRLIKLVREFTRTIGRR